MKLMRHTLAAGAGALALSLAMPAMAQDNESEGAGWEPERPIEFVIQTSPGGGSDVYARLWIGIIEELDLSPVPITPVNMPGGAGAVALTHLRSQAGDPHYITPTLNSVVATPLLQEIPVMYPSEDLTPIAQMTTDPFLLWVNPENIDSWDAFLERCQEERLTGTGTGARQEDEIQILLLQEATDCQPFRYVPQSGGGDVASAVAGQNADFNVNQPSEALPHHPERLIPILTFAEERLEAFSDVPTHIEEEVGTDSDYAELLALETGLHQMRGIIGPPDLPEEAVEWYENLFRQVFESDRWQEFMEESGQVPIFRGPEEYREFLTRFENNHVRMMRDVFEWDLRSDLRDRN